MMRQSRGDGRCLCGRHKSDSVLPSSQGNILEIYTDRILQLCTVRWQAQLAILPPANNSSGQQDAPSVVMVAGVPFGTKFDQRHLLIQQRIWELLTHVISIVAYLRHWADFSLQMYIRLIRENLSINSLRNGCAPQDRMLISQRCFCMHDGQPVKCMCKITGLLQLETADMVYPGLPDSSHTPFIEAQGLSDGFQYSSFYSTGITGDGDDHH